MMQIRARMEREAASLDKENYEAVEASSLPNAVERDPFDRSILCGYLS